MSIYIYIYRVRHVNCYYFKLLISSMFHVLHTVPQTRVNWVLSVRKVVPWRNSLLQKLPYGILYCLALTRSFNTNISKCLGVTSRIDSYAYWWKPNIQSASLCFGCLLAMVTLFLHLASHMAYNSTRRPTTSSLEGPISGSRTLSLTIQTRETILGREKISVITSLLISGCLSPLLTTICLACM